MEKRIPMERVIIDAGIAFVMQREKISEGKELTEIFSQMLEKI